MVFYYNDKLFLKEGFEIRIQHSEDHAEYKDFEVRKHPYQYQDTVVDFKIQYPFDFRQYRIFVNTVGLQSNLNFKFFLDNSNLRILPPFDCINLWNLTS